MKKYWHSEDVFTLYDENDRLFGIIGYSQIAHEDSPDIKFVIYKAYIQPLWSNEFILHSKGELRWDGLTTGLQNPTIHCRGIDILANLLLQFAIYEIAKNEFYIEDIKDDYDQSLLYEELVRNYDKFIEYKNIFTEDKKLSNKIQALCINLKRELTEMSSRAISAMIEDNKGDIEI